MEQHSTQKEKDVYYMKIAKVVATRSKCLSRKIGSVLVRDDHIIATGYNGAPSGVPHCDYRYNNGEYSEMFVSDVCPRQRMGFKSGEGMEHCVAVHAERNSLMQAAKLGISTVGSTLYAYCGTPCLDCMKELIQSGVKRIVCLGLAGKDNYHFDIKNREMSERKEYNFTLSEELARFANITIDVIKEEEIL